MKTTGQVLEKEAPRESVRSDVTYSSVQMGQRRDAKLGKYEEGNSKSPKKDTSLITSKLV